MVVGYPIFDPITEVKQKEAVATTLTQSQPAEIGDA